MPRRFIEHVIYGTLGGLIGAAAMTPLRMLARRLGVIDKQVPQVVEEWLAKKAGVTTRDHAAHQTATQLLHLGYGATWGALFGLAHGDGRSVALPTGLGLGLLQWVLGFGLILPSLGVARPSWRSHAGENAVNIAAHLLYGALTAFVADDLRRQPLPALSHAGRLLPSVG